MRSGLNINSRLNPTQRMTMYLQNATTALVSAKHYNPEYDIALATNLQDKDIPQEFHDIFSHSGIKIFHIPFDEFRFADGVNWGLAFYKLCALYHLVNETNYQNFLYTDSDVYIQGRLAPVFDEARENILLYDINEGLNVPDYVRFLDEVANFYTDRKFVTRYGGEFFAANKHMASDFVNAAREIFNDIKSSGKSINMGDEVLIAITADKFRSSIRNAGSYIFCFWTGQFRLVSTCYKYNAVTVLHIPSEKGSGLVKVYDRYISRGNIPANSTVWKVCRLSNGMTMKNRVKLFVKKFILRRSGL